MEKVALVDSSARWVLQEALRGAWSRVLSATTRKSRTHVEEVRTFFSKARGREADHVVVDLNDPKYAVLLRGWRALESAQRDWKRVLDVGCGGFPFYRFARASGVLLESYIGLDLTFRDADLEFARKCGLRAVECDLADFSPADVEVDAVVFVNVLCYRLDLADTVSKLDDRKWFGASTLLIVEPWPSLLWENFFEGISVKLRRVGVIDAELARAGWTPFARRVLYAYQLGSIKMFRWSSASLYRRDQ